VEGGENMYKYKYKYQYSDQSMHPSNVQDLGRFHIDQLPNRVTVLNDTHHSVLISWRDRNGRNLLTEEHVQPEEERRYVGSQIVHKLIVYDYARERACTLDVELLKPPQAIFYTVRYIETRGHCHHLPHHP
jgi:hypothetical protein